jgi:putative membrane protein
MTAELALVNVVIQCALLVGTATAVVVAKKRRLRRHCLMMRAAVAVQVLTVAFIMAPSLGSYLRHWNGWSLYTAEIMVHMALGVIVLLLFAYINLAFGGLVKAPRSFRPLMRTALTVWVLSLALGIHLYFYIWQ